jgi:hypothetical protein
MLSLINDLLSTPKVPHFDRFFTFWALPMHVAYLAGYAPSTFPLACIVWVGSILHNIIYNRKYYDFWFDLVVHHIPFISFLVAIYLQKKYPDRFRKKTLEDSKKPEALGFAAVALIIYLIVNNGPFTVHKYYKKSHYYYKND